MGKNYFINEGNKIGYMPSTFSANALVEQKIIAGEDLTKGQVVEITAPLTVKATTAASKKVIGVVMFDAKKDEPVSIETEGLFSLTASAGIVAGSLIESAAGGKVATIGGTPVKSIGIALNTASADGKEVIVKFSI